MMSQLAEVNIARMLAPLTDPLMAEFVAQLDAINALADNSPGFLWRLQTPEGNATALRPYEDDLILVNLSLWASLPDLSAFVYKSRHRQVLQQRPQWFERFDGPYLALWWVPSGHIPTVEEAKERLTSLRDPVCLFVQKAVPRAGSRKLSPSSDCERTVGLAAAW
jgi:Domain of unknown function (DUF3291)